MESMTSKLGQYTPLSIYIHTPWCEKKCPYCDFNSHAHADVKQGGIPADLEGQYLTALRRDLADMLQSYPHLCQRELVSIFIGGGTPSLLSGGFYADLLASINNEFVIADTTEITLEANPSSAEYEKFSAYRKLGINRISLGVQSFSNNKLAVLGRVHKGEDAIQAYNAAVAAGFERINLDIMFALPNQSLAEAMEDVRLACATEVGHISRYQLTLEPNTLFAAEPPAGLPDEDAIVAMEEEGGAWLRQQGFRQYEVSAWARDSRVAKGDGAKVAEAVRADDRNAEAGSAEAGDDRMGKPLIDSPALHNMNYWEFGDYVGLGAGAHSKITVPATDTGAGNGQGHKVFRLRRPRSPAKYMNGFRNNASHAPHTNSTTHDARNNASNTTRNSASRSEIIVGAGNISRSELIYEFMLNALRLVDGFSLSLFSDRTGLDPAIIKGEIEKGEELGLLVLEGDWLKPTQRGRQLLNDTILLFSGK